MRNYFTLGGVDSRTFGLYISGRGTFDSPTRELNMLNIPGRNGDLISGVTRLENTTVTYPAFICRDFEANMAALRAFLLSDGGYRRLIDTYHPNEYRMATFRGPLTANVNYRNNAAQFDLTFEVKPQRFLLSGDTETTDNASAVYITNPTLFSARPLIRVYGTGTLDIYNYSTGSFKRHWLLEITGNNEYIDIDCETRDAYIGDVNANEYLAIQYSDDYDFPSFVPGQSAILKSVGISEYVITPRWWTV